MMLVGQYEYHVYELDADIARWKRRFTLRQAALNIGEKLDYLAIEQQLNEGLRGSGTPSFARRTRP